VATILVSYSRHDAAIGAAIAAGLEQAGYHIGRPQGGLHPGTSQTSRMSEAIALCDAAVLVVSSHSATLHEVVREATEALDEGKLLVPVLLDITPTQLQESQTGWRRAISGVATVAIGAGGMEDATSQLVDLLKAHSIYPEFETMGSPILKAVAAAPDKPLPKSLAEKILASRASMEGERKQVTVLFADVAGFTSMSEKLDPEDTHSLISQALTSITEEVHRYEGTIAQFLGDGVMALFGAPIAHEDAPQRALHAAMGIREHLSNYARSLRQRGIVFNMRIGLNTGLVVVGRIGDDLTMEYTAMGDTVNLASRMQRTAQPGTIRVSEDTYRLAEGYFEFKPLGQIRLKGRAAPVKAYELRGLGQARTRFAVSMVRGLTPFVGRKKELNHLMDCFELVKKGQGQVVGIVGEAGVGKSRLLRQMVDVLPPEQYLYLEGECLHYGEAVAYLPILGILRYYFGIDEGEDQSAAKRKIKARAKQLDNEKLEGVLPPLYELFSLDMDDRQYMELQPRRKRELTFEAVRSLLTCESRTRPLILAVEDLQWIDRTSEEFLAQLIGKLPGAAIMVVLLYRPEYRNPWTSKTCYSQVRVDEMSPDTGAEMVQAVLKDGAAAPELNQLIQSRGAGNPLFIEEFTRALLEKGHIKRSNGHYVLTIKPAEIVVPETVQGIIGARIDNLKGDLKRTLQVSSVIGREFSSTVLQMTMGLSAGLEEALNELQGLELIYEKNLFPEMEYTFKHALTQDVAYNSLLVRSRREIHQKVGQAIEHLYPQKQEEFCETLAHHYSKAEDLEKAYQYLRLSGDKAFRNYSMSESFRHYREALNILARLPDTRENKVRRVEVTVSITQPMLALSFEGDSLQILEECRRPAEEIGDSSSLAKLYAFLAHGMSFKGDSARCVEYGQKSLMEAERSGEIEAAVVAATNVSGSLCFRGDFNRALEIAKKGILLIEKNGRTTESFGTGFPLYPALMVVHGYSEAMLGDFAEGEPCCEQMIRFATEAKHLRTMAVAEVVSGLVSTVRGRDLESCFKHLENGVRYSKETGFVPYLALAWTCIGWAHWLKGSLDMAQEYGQKAISAQSGGEITAMSALTHLLLGAVGIDSGNLPSAQNSIDEALKLARVSRERYIEGRALTWLGRALGKADGSQAAAAEQQIMHGIELLEQMRIRPWEAEGHLLAGELYTDTGQEQKALASLNRAQGMFQQMEMTHWLFRTQRVLDRLQV
jgi:class 3 adenylate cyclase/tetratricopeptide (TPR) repeat protein/energy-coupling factor transporter ATP-binding protein EcfA2